MPIFGAKSRAKRGCASKLACGRRIGPLGSYEFAEEYRKSTAICRVDVGIDPYNRMHASLRIRRKSAQIYSPLLHDLSDSASPSHLPFAKGRLGCGGNL